MLGLLRRKPRKPRPRSLGFESLEHRSLLAAYPAGFIGPVELDATFYEPAAVGVFAPILDNVNPTTPLNLGGDFPGFPFAPPVPQPIVIGSGASTNSIGGHLRVDVDANTSFYKIKKVEYTVTGGAIQFQTWTKQYGGVTYTTGETHTWAGTPEEPYVTGDDYDVQWSATPGARSVKVDVTYNDPASTVRTVTLEYTAQQPNVTDSKVSGLGTSFGLLPGSTDKIGFYNGPPVKPGQVSYQADVSTIPSTGTFSWVQLVDIYSQMTYASFDPATGETHHMARRRDFSDGGKLDWDTVNIEIAGWTSPFYAPAGGPFHIQDGMVSDAPYYTAKVVTDPTYWVPVRLEDVTTFTTYLLWTPSEGAHVAVSRVTWAMSNYADYHGSLAQPAAGVELADPTKWTYTMTKPGPWEEHGSQFNTFPIWTDYADVTGSKDLISIDID